MATDTVPTVSSRPEPAPQARRHLAGRFWRHNATGWALMLPYIIYFSLFTAFPIGFAIYLSFHRWNNLFKPPIPHGFSNYIYLFHDANFWNALHVTIVFAVVFVVVTVPLALSLALLLNQALPGRSFFRVVFFMPYITPAVVISIVFLWLYQTQNGILNNILGFFGISPVPWLTDTAVAMPAISLMVVWKQAGYFTVIFLAGLQGIPRQLYEAAAVDGATGWRQFRDITVPLLAPAMLLVVVFATLTGFSIFTEPYILTQGGPDNATLTVTLYIYKWAFEYSTFGYASALGVVFAVIVFIIVAIQRLVFERDSYT
ncbi:MAG TPA: sugar ABC transporter permease [Chloroflexota bacterium]|nr:sugar ABC transporter permease [Chloroflexota bacterium]